MCAERLNAELILDDGAGAEGFWATWAGGEGSEKSKRSFEAGADGLAGAGAGLDAKLKSPKSFDESGSGFAWGNWGGLEAIGALDANFGPASKKPPPLKGGDVICGAATEER